MTNHHHTFALTTPETADKFIRTLAPSKFLSWLDKGALGVMILISPISFGRQILPQSPWLRLSGWNTDYDIRLMFELCSQFEPHSLCGLYDVDNSWILSQDAQNRYP